MRTWSLEKALEDMLAPGRQLLAFLLAPALDFVYPPDERWQWPQDGSEALNEREEAEESTPLPDYALRDCNCLLAEDRGTACLEDGAPQRVTLSGREYERYLCGALNEHTEAPPTCWHCGATAVDNSDRTGFRCPTRGCLQAWILIRDYCPTEEASAAAAVAETGLGGMSDAEPPPGPGSPAVSDIPPSPAGEHLSDGDCFDYCVGHPEDEPHQVDPATYTTAEAFQSAANILEDLRREHTNVWLDPQMYDLRGFIADLYSRAAAFRRAESKLGGVDWAADTYPQHRKTQQ